MTFPPNASQGRRRSREDVKDGTPAGGHLLRDDLGRRPGPGAGGGCRRGASPRHHLRPPGSSRPPLPADRRGRQIRLAMSEGHGGARKSRAYTSTVTVRAPPARRLSLGPPTPPRPTAPDAAPANGPHAAAVNGPGPGPGRGRDRRPRRGCRRRRHPGPGAGGGCRRGASPRHRPLPRPRETPPPRQGSPRHLAIPTRSWRAKVARLHRNKGRPNATDTPPRPRPTAPVPVPAPAPVAVPAPAPVAVAAPAPVAVPATAPCPRPDIIIYRVGWSAWCPAAPSSAGETASAQGATPDAPPARPSPGASARLVRGRDDDTTASTRFPAPASTRRPSESCSPHAANVASRASSRG